MNDLKEEFERQAEWRREKAAEHPNDKARNIDAAEIFDGLAATVADVPSDVLTAAEELFDDYPDGEVWQDMLREVGFQSHPANAEQFVREFIAMVTVGSSG